MGERDAPEATDFNEYAGTYREDLERSIAFSGANADLFIGLKADLVTEIAGRHLGEPGTLNAIDVGCGVGETARFLKGRFGGLHGADIAAESVARAAEEHPWVNYRTYDAGEPVPFAEESFDLAFTICVLHHVPPSEREEFAAEMTRVVRPGGVVAIFEHNPLNPLTRKAVNSCPFDADAVLASRRETKRLLSGAGLEVVESPYIVFFPREGERLRAIERRLGWLPLGAQYYVAARKP